MDDSRLCPGNIPRVACITGCAWIAVQEHCRQAGKTADSSLLLCFSGKSKSCSRVSRGQKKTALTLISQPTVLTEPLMLAASMKTKKGEHGKRAMPDRELDELAVLLDQVLQLLLVCKLIGILLEVQGDPSTPLQGLPTVIFPHLCYQYTSYHCHVSSQIAATPVHPVSHLGLL